MVLPAVLMAVGTATQIFSQWMANLDQAQAEYENAKFYKEQADAARYQMNRELDIADREYEYRKGATIGAEAASGVDVGSGSSVNNIAAVAAAKIKELSAIKIQGDLQIKLSRMRAARSSSIGDTLSSTQYNLTQGATTLIGNYTKSEGFGTKFSGLREIDNAIFGTKEQNITGAPV